MLNIRPILDAVNKKNKLSGMDDVDTEKGYSSAPMYDKNSWRGNPINRRSIRRREWRKEAEDET